MARLKASRGAGLERKQRSVSGGLLGALRHANQ